MNRPELRFQPFVKVKLTVGRFRYKIVPLGSFSRIEEMSPGKGVYELYVPLHSHTLSSDMLRRHRQVRFFGFISRSAAP